MKKLLKRSAALLFAVALVMSMLVVPTSAAKKRNISQCKIKVDNDVFTGYALKPNTVVKDGSTKLKYGTDYTLKYSNNIVSGTGKVEIKGKGKYTGTVTRNFTIYRCNLSECTIIPERANWWDWQPSVTVKHGSAVINPACYKVTYYKDPYRPLKMSAVVRVFVDYECWILWNSSITGSKEQEYPINFPW